MLALVLIRVLELTLAARKNQQSAIAEVIMMIDVAVFPSISLRTLHSFSHHTPAVIKARSLPTKYYS